MYKYGLTKKKETTEKERRLMETRTTVRKWENLRK